MSDGSEAPLIIEDVSTGDSILKISTKVENGLEVAVNDGINARLKLISPGKHEQDSSNAVLYRFLSRGTIRKVAVKVNRQTFVPSDVETASGLMNGSTSFNAFGFSIIGWFVVSHCSSFYPIQQKYFHRYQLGGSVEAGTFNIIKPFHRFYFTRYGSHFANISK